jgi:hypothetical protein
VYNLPLRALQGFVKLLFDKLAINLLVPSYTQISRRAQVLNKKISTFLKKGAQDLVFDSNRLKVYDGGEWKVRIHGKSKRRTWKNFILASIQLRKTSSYGKRQKNNEGDGEVAKNHA